MGKEFTRDLRNWDSWW